MYLILPSNALAPDFPENKSSNFTIPLPSILFTPSKQRWKVGLMQIQLPLTFYNLEGDESIEVQTTDNGSKRLSLPEGVFLTPEKLCAALNGIGTDHFHINWRDGFRIKLEPQVTKLVLSSSVAELLSCPLELTDHMNVDEKGYISSGTSVFDPWINFKVIFVECGLAEGVQINDSSRPIIQAVTPPDHAFGDTFSYSFFPVDLLPVQGESHSVIRIKVTDVQRKPIKFRAGNVILGLILSPSNARPT